MTVLDVRNDTQEEIGVLLSPDFGIDVTGTDSVPHSDDGAITFPNFDNKVQRCKVIETAVLHIDIRRSTELNIAHRPATMAKLYSAFVRSMTRCAQEFRGHVRGIIGDRLMVIFNPGTAFVDAVDAAILMNSVTKHVLAPAFKQNAIRCGIGIDHGKMLVTKTGVRRHGVEQANYRSLVWLGPPANIASKLTDIANKYESHTSPIVREATRGISAIVKPIMGLLQPDPTAGGLLGPSLGLGSNYSALGALGNALSPTPEEWDWHDVEVEEFLRRLNMNPLGYTLQHSNPDFRSFFVTSKSWSHLTPPILMTESVFKGFRAARPHDNSLAKKWWKPVTATVPSYGGRIYGGDVIFSCFNR